MLSDEEILERGGTQEDIDAYAHDVGGACGAAYGGKCDYCGKGVMTVSNGKSAAVLRDALSRLYDAGTYQKSRAGGTTEAEFAYKKHSVADALAALEEIMVAAKPGKKSTKDYGSWEEGHRNVGWNNGIEQFEQNIRQAFSNNKLPQQEDLDPDVYRQIEDNFESLIGQSNTNGGGES